MKAIVLTSCLIMSILLGCATSSRAPGDFVRTTHFSKLDTFSYKHTLSTGMTWRDSDQYSIKELSESVLTQELLARGFEEVDTGSDFYVVTKWRKALSSYPMPFQSIDGPREAMDDRLDPNFKAAVRYTLIVEIYETDTRQLFWRVELANLFDATQFSEERVGAALQRAIQNFPKRIEKDPNLPNIE